MKILRKRSVIGTGEASAENEVKTDSRLKEQCEEPTVSDRAENSESEPEGDGEGSEPSDSAESQEPEDKKDDGITEGFAKEAKAFAEGKGLSQEEYDEVMNELRLIRDSATPPTIKMFELIYKAINYDHDVAQAAEQGEIKGRNTQIEKLFMQPKQSDGLPHLNGGSTPRQSQTASIFDLARSVR